MVRTAGPVAAAAAAVAAQSREPQLMGLALQLGPGTTPPLHSSSAAVSPAQPQAQQPQPQPQVSAALQWLCSPELPDGVRCGCSVGALWRSQICAIGGSLLHENCLNCDAQLFIAGAGGALAAVIVRLSAVPSVTAADKHNGEMKSAEIHRRRRGRRTKL